MLKLEKIYKSETVLEILQEAILSGDLEAGAEITQVEAALSLGVSRMPVREALLSLEYCGLVERLPSQHVRVATLDDETIKNIFDDMALLAVEIIRNLKSDELCELVLSTNQFEFHRALREKIKSPLRKKIFEIMTEVYLSFVLKNSEGMNNVNEIFKDLLTSIKTLNKNIEEVYKEYSIVLVNEFVKIRKNQRSKDRG